MSTIGGSLTDIEYETENGTRRGKVSSGMAMMAARG